MRGQERQGEVVLMLSKHKGVLLNQRAKPWPPPLAMQILSLMCGSGGSEVWAGAKTSAGNSVTLCGLQKKEQGQNQLQDLTASFL